MVHIVSCIQTYSNCSHLIDNLEKMLMRFLKREFVVSRQSRWGYCGQGGEGEERQGGFGGMSRVRAAGTGGQCNPQGRVGEVDVCRRRALNSVCPVEGHLSVISVPLCDHPVGLRALCTRRDEK